MGSPDPDSRTSSVGTKRRFNTITSDTNVVNLDSSSDDDVSDKPQKRTRLNHNYNPGGQAASGNNSTGEDLKQEPEVEPVIEIKKVSYSASQQPPEVYPEVGTVSDVLEGNHEPTFQQSTNIEHVADVQDTMLDDNLSENTTQRSVQRVIQKSRRGSTPPPTEFPLPVLSAPAWNKGIQGGLRTSFGNRAIQTQAEKPLSGLTSIVDIKAVGDQSSIESRLVVTTSEPFIDVDNKIEQHVEKVKASENQFLARAIAMAAEDNSEARTSQQADARNSGRVVLGGTSLSPIEFLVPVLADANGKKPSIADVMFLEHFVPMFVALNVEKVHSMSHATTVQAFETLISMDYSFLRQSRAAKKLAGPKSQNDESYLNDTIKSVTGKTLQDIQSNSSLSTPILEMSAAEDHGPGATQPKRSATSKKAFRLQRDAGENKAVAIASDMGKQRISGSRSKYEAILNLQVGRVFRERTASSSFVDFVLPLLMGSNGERMDLEYVRFLEHFVPLFVGLNLERISTMKLSTALGAFQACLQQDYRDQTADQIRDKVSKANAFKKEKILDAVIKSVTGKSRAQLNDEPFVEKGATERVPKSLPLDTGYIAPENSSAQLSTVGQPDEMARTSSHESSTLGYLKNGGQVAHLNSVTGKKPINTSMDDEELPPISQEQGKIQGRDFNEAQTSTLTPESIVVDTLMRVSIPISSKIQRIEANADKAQNSESWHITKEAATDAARDSAKQQTTAKAVVSDSKPQPPPQSTDRQTLTDRVSPMMENSSKESNVEYGVDELALMRQYYPGNPSRPFVPRCMTCAVTGHKTSQCPRLECSLCGVSGLHFTSGCPEAQRCTKCRQHGHLKEGCFEKLIAISGGPSCALCNSKGHFELDCDLLWRSFEPSSVTSFKVRYISHACYYCGSNQHFGPDCGVRSSAARQSGSRTWSRANWDHYIETQSELRAPSTGIDYSLPRKKDFSIRGRANNPITLDSDDDDEPAFLGRQVVKPSRPEPQPKKHIKFSQQGPNNVESSTAYTGRDMQAPRLIGSGLHGGQYGADGRVDSRDFKSNTSYRPRDDSARHGRERSFSPPPPYSQHGNGFQPPLPPGPPPKGPASARPHFVPGPFPSLEQPQGGAKIKKKTKKSKKKETSKQANTQPPIPISKTAKRARNRAKNAQGNGRK